jgi:DNA polymerase (family 10)
MDARTRPDAAAVAALLKEFGQRSELAGGNPYQARAYYRAAEALRAVPEPLDDLIAQERLQEIPGIGAAIAERITTLAATGTHPKLDSMRQTVPASALAMLEVPRLRARDVLKLHGLGINSLGELEEAVRSGQGISPALQQTILRGIEVMRAGAGLRHMHRAEALTRMAIERTRAAHPELTRIEPAGELRRGCELVGRLRLVAQLPEDGAPIRIAGSGEIALTLAGRNRYGVALLLATGSEAHVAALQDIAKAKGLTLDEKGLRRGRTLVPCADEDTLYDRLGLAFVPPELREDGHEVAVAAAGQLPDLVELSDLRGILHAHTDASDGGNTLKQMADATRKRGYSYFGVADHSQSAHYAGGLKPADIARQHKEIDALNRRTGDKFRVFKGIESDILPDGALDYPDALLKRFDFVVASIHSRFSLDRAAQTKRLLRAVAHPATTILGHMTGRMLLRRPGYEVDVEAVLQACAKHGVAVEVNANPHRLDLDWRWHARALELGCMLSINPDAHSTAELDLTRFGVSMARKGGVPAARVLNALGLAEIGAHFAARKTKVAPPKAAKAGAKRRVS